MSNLKGGTDTSLPFTDTCATQYGSLCETWLAPCPTPSSVCPTCGGAGTCIPNKCAGTGETDYAHCWTVPSKGYCL